VWTARAKRLLTQARRGVNPLTQGDYLPYENVVHGHARHHADRITVTGNGAGECPVAHVGAHPRLRERNGDVERVHGRAESMTECERARHTWMMEGSARPPRARASVLRCVARSVSLDCVLVATTRDAAWWLAPTRARTQGRSGGSRERSGELARGVRAVRANIVVAQNIFA
jgi:hypothetical protein